MDARGWINPHGDARTGLSEGCGRLWTISFSLVMKWPVGATPEISNPRKECGMITAHVIAIDAVIAAQNTSVTG